MIILKDAGSGESPDDSKTDPTGAPRTSSHLRKYVAAVEPGRTEYRIVHNLNTKDVIVQTRIAGRIREGGLSIVDANTVQLTFGEVLYETIDIVIIG